MLRDRLRLQRRLQGAAKVRNPQAQAAIAQELGERSLRRKRALRCVGPVVLPSATHPNYR